VAKINDDDNGFCFCLTGLELNPGQGGWVSQRLPNENLTVELKQDFLSPAGNPNGHPTNIVKAVKG